MEEEVTEPGPQALELTALQGTRYEANGDLPGNPRLRDGTEDATSPAGEPAVLQCPSQRCG